MSNKIKIEFENVWKKNLKKEICIQKKIIIIKQKIHINNERVMSIHFHNERILTHVDLIELILFLFLEFHTNLKKSCTVKMIKCYCTANNKNKTQNKLNNKKNNKLFLLNKFLNENDWNRTFLIKALSQRCRNNC